MAAHQVPQGERGRGGGRGDVSKTADGPTVTPDGPTPTVAPEQQPKGTSPGAPRPTGLPPSDPTPLLQPRPVDPPSFLYLIIAGLALLALLLAWYTYKLRLRLAGTSHSGTSDSGPSLFVSPSAAQAGAIKGIKDFGLDSREKWGPYLLSEGALVSPMEPVLVQQIETTDFGEAFYYLVPFGRDLASVRAIACVDGVTGEYQECSRFEGSNKGGGWGQMFAPWRTAASTRATIMERKINLHVAATSTALPGQIGVHPHLVWKACKESQSVFLPFRLVKVGDNVRYIRIDGVVFDQLS